MASFWSPFKTKRYWKQYAIVAGFLLIAIAFLNILSHSPSLANAMVAFGTLILALVTTLSIINSNEQEKRDRKERWLNEIIEWAVNIINWRSENKDAFRDIISIKSPKEQRMRKYAHIIEVKETLVGMRGRNQYTSKITLKLSPSLHKAVEKLIKGVEEYIEMLDNWQHAIAADIALADDENYANKANTSERQVDELADKVIEEAAKIKTGDIG